MGAFWNAWDHDFRLFTYLYLSWFHKGFELVVWDYQKKKRAELNSSFAISKATTIKHVYF